MAKDKRPKTKSSEKSQQVSLTAGTGKAAGTSARSSGGAKKKKKSKGKTVVTTLLIVLIVISLIFVVVLGVSIYQSLSTPKENTNSVVLSSYVTTPESQRQNVGYYLVGLMGAEESSDTDMLAMVCYDKKQQTVQVLQVPAATYLGDGDTWAVKKAGSVWANPKPLTWCESCRRQVFEPEIQDGKHNIDGCHAALTQKTGSSSENLIRVFNEQYSLPVDNFFLLPQEALVKLVNLVGGIDVNLEADMTVGKINYKKGVRTLDGESALQYMTTFNYKSTPDSDVDRLVRQRKVLAALMQRLTNTSKEKLDEDIIGALMGGSTPIRTNADTEEMIDLVLDMKNVRADQSAFYVLPGESAKSGKDTYYSVHRADLANLLQTSFNPYGEAITEASLSLTELDNSKKTDLKKQLLSEVQVQQSGTATTTGSTTSSTKAE